MQTWLPLPCVYQSAQCLDKRRLNKQVVENSQIINAISRIVTETALSQGSIGWSRHPAVLMWLDNVTALAHYQNACIAEAKVRGIRYKNIKEFEALSAVYDMPEWWGGRIHETHRMALLFKSERRMYLAESLVEILEYYEAGLVAELPMRKSRRWTRNEILNEFNNAQEEYNWYHSFGWDSNIYDVRENERFPGYFWPKG